MEEGEFLRDAKARYALRMALVEAVESASGLALEILRVRGRVAGAEEYPRLFRLLGEEGVISPEAASGMVRLARLRNPIVRGYWEVDDLRIYREARSGGLELLRRFLSEVMEAAPGG